MTTITVRHGLGRASALALLQAQLGTIPGSSVRVYKYGRGIDGPSQVGPGALLLSLSSGSAITGSYADTSAAIDADANTVTLWSPATEKWPQGLIDALRKKVELVIWTQGWVDQQLAAGKMSTAEIADAQDNKMDVSAANKTVRALSRVGGILRGLAYTALIGVGVYIAAKVLPKVVK